MPAGIRQQPQIWDRAAQISLSPPALFIVSRPSGFCMLRVSPGPSDLF